MAAPQGVKQAMFDYIACVDEAECNPKEIANVSEIFLVQSLSRACVRVCLCVWLLGQANGFREPEHLVGAQHGDMDYSECCVPLPRQVAICTCAFVRQVPGDPWL
jgi:hypothetical protein